MIGKQIQVNNMCLYPRFIKNRKYTPTKKNGGNVPDIKDLRTQYVPVGCGKCIECKKQKAREWQIRLYEELKKDKNCYFVTLTFSEEELTKLEKEFSIKESNAIATIAVRRYLERRRKYYKKSIKHWLITELGHENTERIHLHGIIWTNDKDEIEKFWKYGRVGIGTYCNKRTINYIVKYVTKTDKDHIGYQPTILCSKGIGNNYLNERFRHEYRPLNTKEYYTTETGHKINLPIYYRNHFFTEEQREELWLEKLDKKRIYILGNKYPTKTKEDLKTIDRIRKIAQKINIELGYGDLSKEWNKKEYNTRLCDLNFK